MLKRRLSVLFPSLFLTLGAGFGACIGWAADDVSQAVKDAISEAKAIPMPDYALLQSQGAIKDFTSSVTGDTHQTESLYQSGQGQLFAPGRNEADRCQGQTDSHCIAVQIVDRGSTEKPTIDPDVSGNLIGGRDDVVGNADKWVDEEKLNGNGTSVGNCRPNVSTVTKPAQTQTCDVRVATTSTSVTHTCSIDFESIYSETSLWACEIFQGGTENKTCSVPVVVKQETTSTLTCFEGKVDPVAKTCSVIVTPYTEARHQATCVKPQFKSVTRTCTRRLVVVPETTCRIGSVAETSVTDYADLTEDGVPGADTLKASYTCAESPLALLLTVNAKVSGDGADLQLRVGADAFNISRDIEGGRVQLTGQTSCTAADCISEIHMRVFQAKGLEHIYTGEVAVRLAFKKFVKTAEKEQWSESCTGL